MQILCNCNNAFSTLKISKISLVKSNAILGHFKHENSNIRSSRENKISGSHFVRISIMDPQFLYYAYKEQGNDDDNEERFSTKRESICMNFSLCSREHKHDKQPQFNSKFLLSELLDGDPKNPFEVFICSSHLLQMFPFSVLDIFSTSL